MKSSTLSFDTMISLPIYDWILISKMAVFALQGSYKLLEGNDGMDPVHIP